MEPEALPDPARDAELDTAIDRTVVGGIPRLLRSWAGTLSTGFVAGLEVGLGVLALLYVKEQTGSQILAGLAFSIGFIALLLGRSELFTEGFMTPIAVVAAKRARLSDAVKLWSGTLAGNLAGGIVIAWFAMRAFPQLNHEAIHSASYFVDMGWTLRSFSLAILAGMAITLMTRMHNGTDSVVGKLVASVAIAFLLAGLRLFHSILDSLVIFFALQTTRAPFGYLAWLGFFALAVVGNVVGGVGFTTLVRLVRSHQRLIEHRQAAEADAERGSASVTVPPVQGAGTPSQKGGESATISNQTVLAES